MSEPDTYLVGSALLRSVLWASAIEMMAVETSLVRAAMRAPDSDINLLRESAKHAIERADGQLLFTVPTRLLDVLLRLPGACVELVDVRERKVRTWHSPEDFVAAELELREVVARARANSS